MEAIVTAAPRVPPECQAIQREIDGLEQTIRGLQEDLRTAPPSQKPAIIAQIREAQREKSAAEARLDRCVTGARSFLDVVGVEDTQTIQYFEFNGTGSGAGRPNTIPMVARKSVIVRVYVAAQRHQAPFPASVSGTLTYQHLGGPSFSPLSPMKSPITARAARDLDRAAADHTLDFQIPADHCRGTLSLTLNLFDPANPGFETTRRLNPLIFREIPQLRVHGVLIHYTGKGLDIAAPTAQVFVDSFSYLLRTYPISGVQYTGCDVVDFKGDLTKGGDVRGDSGSGSGNGCGDGWDRLLTMLTNMRAASNTRDIYVGLLPSGVPVNKFSGCARGRVCATFALSTTLIAHEIGHTLGRKHAPCGDPANVDGSFPRYANYPKASIGEVGINNTTGSLKNPATHKDFMSYCGPTWISPYTYTGMMDRIVDTMEVAETGDIRERLYLNFRVRGRSRVEWLQSFHLPGPPPSSADGPLAPYTVELLDADGQVLESHRCHHDDIKKRPDDPDLNFHESVPWHPEVRSITLRRDGELLETLALEPEAPGLRVAEWPTVSSRSSLMRIEWEPTAGAATYLLRYSNDGGISWRAIATDLRGTSQVVNIGLLPGGDECLFQVVATSGVRTTTAQTTTFPVERKPRRAYVLSPKSGAKYREGKPVILRGGGFSPDAHTTDFDEITWSSNRDGELGVGYEVVVRSLSPGKHTITMRFPDGLGGEASADIPVEIT